MILEGLVIVLSILLAFGIEAWWSGQQEDRAITTALTNLDVAFTEHIAMVDAELQRMTLFEERVLFFLNQDADSIDVGTGTVLEAIHRPIVEPLNSDEVIALLEAEALSYLNAAGLWAESARWRSRWRVIVDRHDSLYELEDEALRAIAGLETTRAVIVTAQGRFDAGPSVLQAARQDETLLSLAAVKAYHLRILRLLLTELRDAANSVSVQLRGELAR